MGLDIGPESIQEFQNALEPCQTIVWNGKKQTLLFSLSIHGYYMYHLTCMITPI